MVRVRSRVSARAARSWMAGIALSLGAGGVAAAPDLAGHWDGAIDIQASIRLEVSIDIRTSDAGFTGSISIPQQNAVDLPLVNIATTPDGATFTIDGVPGMPTFDGRFADDGATLAGDFRQGGQTFPFSLTRTDDPIAGAAAALDGLDAAIESAMEKMQVPGLAVGVVYKDEVIYAKGFGRRNVEEDLPVTSRTLFAIGSSSKAFTTFTLATLVEEGRLDWDEPVQTYLPDFRLHDEYASTHVTTRDMVSHRTGLPRHDLMWYNNTKVDRAELVRRLRYLEPNKGLREAWQYNNLMFLTAGSLAGALHGGTWEDAVRARVLEPLGMHDVTFSVVESQKTSDYAMPYTVHEEAIERMAFRDISLIGPAGSINAGVDDMCKWLRVHLDQGRVGDRELVGAAGMSDMHSVQMAMGGIPTDAEIVTVGYGMGWMIDVYHGHYRVHHGGNIDGFSALVSLLPRDRLGVVVLTNMNATGLTELVVREVTDRVLDLEDRDWFGEAAMQREQMLAAGKAAEETKQDPRVAGTTLNHPLEAYAGRYEHPGYGIVTFSMDGDHLAVEYNDITAPLEHWHYEVFSGLENPDDRTFNDMKFSFNHDIQGHLVSVSMQFDPFVDPIVFTRLADARLTDPAYLDHFVGRFSIAGQPLRIFRRANALWAQSPGQPASELVAAGDDRFVVKEVTMVSFEFRLDEAGVPVMNIVLPNGIFDLVPAASSAKDEPEPATPGG